jgi:hypothetical protein
MVLLSMGGHSPVGAAHTNHPGVYTFNLIRLHVRLKDVVSCFNIILWGQFLREICSPKKTPQKVAVI